MGEGKKREPLPMPEGAQILLQLSLMKSAVQNYFFLVLFAAFFVAFLAVFFAAFLVVFFAAFFVAFFAVLAATITYLLVGELLLRQSFDSRPSQPIPT